MLLNFKHSHVLHIVENTQARSPPLCLHKLVISLLCHWRGLIQTGPDSPRNWVLIIYLLKFKNWKCCGFLYFNLSYYVSMFEWQDNQKSQKLGDFSIHFYLYPFPVYSVKIQPRDHNQCCWSVSFSIANTVSSLQSCILQCTFIFHSQF